MPGVIGLPGISSSRDDKVTLRGSTAKTAIIVSLASPSTEATDCVR